MGVADDQGNAGESGEVVRCALSVTTGDNDASGGIRRVNLTDGVASLSVGGGRDRAGVENNDVGRRAIGRDGAALIAQLALNGGAIGLRGAAAELFNVEGGHILWRLEGIFKHRYQGIGNDGPETCRVCDKKKR